MKAMLLAAGWGTRMGSLTEKTPKPLISVHGKPLIVYHIERLVQAGITEMVINTSRFPEQFRQVLGTGEKFGAQIHYSDEGENKLETGGGIVKALPLLGENPFLIISTDVWTNYSFSNIAALSISEGVHLVLVQNPPHHPLGDFALSGNRVLLEGENRLNYGGIALLHPSLFTGCLVEAFPIAKLFRKAIQEEKASGEYFEGEWVNVDTLARLASIVSCSTA